MTEAIWIAVIVAVPTVIVSAFVPIAMKIIDNNERRKDREADNKRADILAERTKTVAEKVDKAADLLLENNSKVAETAKETKGQLFAIHTLVNSEKTEGIRRELVLANASLVLMNEVVRLNRRAGLEPDADALASIETTNLTITDLEAKLHDQLKATATVEKHQESEKT